MNTTPDHSDMQTVFNLMTDRARRATVFAEDEARQLNHNYVGTEHLLLGLLAEGTTDTEAAKGIAVRALTELGISLTQVRSEVEHIIGRGQAPTDGNIPFTPRTKKVLHLSLREALQMGHNWVGAEHILLGLIREGDGVGAHVLIRCGAELSRARQKVIKILAGHEKTESPAGAGPDLTTLPQRMRYAADVIQEARKEYHRRPENLNSNWVASAWDSSNLRHHADQWESETPREELAESIFLLLAAQRPDDWHLVTRETQQKYREVAHKLLESGWHKEEPA